MSEGVQEFLAIQRAMNLACREELLVLKATWDITEMHKHRNTPGGVSSNLIFCQNKCSSFWGKWKWQELLWNQRRLTDDSLPQNRRDDARKWGELTTWFIPSENTACISTFLLSLTIQGFCGPAGLLFSLANGIFCHTCTCPSIKDWY